MAFPRRLPVALGICLGLAGMLSSASPAAGQPLDVGPFTEMRWRMIGPFRGGRTVAVSGVPGQPNVFYMAPNNGGVWKSTDYGRVWTPIFDDQPTGSIGALAVAPSDPNVLYVGSGEGLQRPDLSVGDGVYKSTDAGKTWRHLGLADGRQIAAILVDPKDSKRLFVAVLGHPYGPNTERGVFRSTDGGETWHRVLFKDEDTGAVDLAFDPRDPQKIYAVLWSSRQGPWEYGNEYEGPGSGLFVSADGGTTWRQLTKGLPSSAEGLGRIGIAVAPSDPKRMYAVVSARERAGGLFRSDDAGESWRRVNSENRVTGRGGDFAEVRVDPKNPDIVYCANTSTYRSTDGGTTFTAIKGAPGGDDYHRIWINPENPQVMILGADQGATITVNGGETWSSWYNQPTAQFFHVSTDNRFPYRVYGGQQESGSAAVWSRGNDGAITFREFHPGRSRGIRLRRARSPPPRRHLRRQAHSLRRGDRPDSERGAGAPARREGPVRPHGAGHLLSRRSSRSLLRLAGPVEDLQRRRDLGGREPGPDARRPGNAAEPRAPRGQGHDEAPGRHLFDRSFSQGHRHDLGGDRRRPDPRHP